MDDRPILLIGAGGQLGQALKSTLGELGIVVTATREDADLSDLDTVRALIRETTPRLLVNAAAYTAVDDAETDAERARLVNAIAPGVMAEEAERCGAGMVHYSTDYVFDGTQDRPYREDDPTNPTSVYGQTKLEGEERVAASASTHWILRTSWLYGPNGSNFVRTMLQLGTERDQLQVVDDQIGCPTSTLWLADATRDLLRFVNEHEDPSATAGIYHAVARGQTSWYGFAQAIFQNAGMEVDVDPVDTSAFPRPAPRPAYSVLDTAKLRQTFGIIPPSWTRQLADTAPHLTVGRSSGS
ncbi:dTDP-4-dehydrorhamnose reductase [Longibacter salinarum]|uniref:dTDP-4-dehydrorhamnose reductase n=1 Tax=Longibacter salinarum TaxID=1850348 RepID=UPI001FE63FFC|nr:dTDP-4-dehydrorhamnose reductase [Longibacter salinarum]